MERLDEELAIFSSLGRKSVPIMDWTYKSRVTEWNGEKTCMVEVDQKEDKHC
jgi:hypothetical protein